SEESRSCRARVRNDDWGIQSRDPSFRAPVGVGAIPDEGEAVVGYTADVVERPAREI
ncbi:unnamed protein product, partial [marine sediment metagenome]